jgi:hypothetical protein
MRRLILFVLLMGMLFAVPMAGAQQETCLAVAQAAFDGLMQCSDSSAASACYAMAAEADPGEGFASVGDQISLTDLQSVTTAPLDLDAEQWGMARLNVHANVPLMVSETGLTYVLIGDATIENAVDGTTAFVPASPVTIQALVGANLRSAPSTDARVVESAAAGTQLMASGISADGGWVYVTTESGVAWVSTQIVAPLDGDLSSLPVVTNNSRSLMQSFILTTGVESSPCSEQSPSMLLIQAPDGVTASITMNGMDVRFSDAIVMRATPDNQMQLFVLAGGASTGVLSVPAGFTAQAELSEDGSDVVGAWSNLRPISPDERTFLGVLELIPSEALYIALNVPTEAEVAATLASVNQASAGAVQAVSASGSGNCEGFRPTSPLDGFAFGQTTFYWDGVAGADQYRVNVYTDGQLSASTTIDALSTTTNIDTSSGGIGDGQGYGWNVEALSGGQVICTSGTVAMLRSANTQVVSDGGGDGGSDDGGGNNCGWGGC